MAAVRPPYRIFEHVILEQWIALRQLIFRLGTKFGAKILIDAQITAQNRSSRWRLSAILDFRKLDFWPTGLLKPLILSGYQIWCKNVDQCRNYGEKSKFKMAAVRHLGFSKPDIWPLGPLGLPIFHHCTIFGAKMLIDAQITSQNRNSRWRPSAILEFLYHIGPPTKSFCWATPACQILC